MGWGKQLGDAVEGIGEGAALYTVAKADPKGFLTFSYMNVAFGLVFMLIFFGFIFFFFWQSTKLGKNIQDDKKTQ